jgi:hypothetical protein
LEFLHESAGLVHGNLSPEAIYINVKVCYSAALLLPILISFFSSPTGKYLALRFQVHPKAPIPRLQSFLYLSLKC